MPQQPKARPVFAWADDSPWARCYAQFLQNIYRRGQSQSSVATYRSMLTTFFGRNDEHDARMPDEITREDVLTYVTAISRSNRNFGKPPAIATMNMRLSVIKSFYTFASSFEYTDATGTRRILYDRANPAAGLASGKLQRRYRALSQAELERLFAVIPKDTIKGVRDRAIFLLYLWTLRRRNEIADLRWGDIEEGTITNPDGSRHTGTIYRFRNKGAKMVDDIAELPPLAKAALDVYLEKSGRKATMTPESPLFTSTMRDTGTRLAPGHIAWILKKYVRQAGLDTRTTLHTFRHTGSRMRFLAGSSLEEIRQVLRHKYISTTDLYIKGLTVSGDPGAKLLEEAFGKL